MPSFQNAFQALVNLCATLEVKQEQDEMLRVKVMRIKEQCLALLKAPPDKAEKILQQLPLSLNTVLAKKDKLTTNTQAFLDHLNEIKNDTLARKELCADLVSMEEYGLTGREDEETKKEMRIDAFEEAINGAKCDMQKSIHFRSHATINKFLKIHTGQSASEIKETILPIKPVEEDEPFEKKSQTDLDEAIKELTKKLELYKNVCIDYQRPGNSTMQALLQAIMTSYSLSQLNMLPAVLN